VHFLEQGAALDTLVADNPHKVRNDESSLSKDRLAEDSTDGADGTKKQPVVDATLQRAMHLHRALIAMKKI
jgi:hypothetical protein